MPARGKKKYYRIGEVSRITGVEPHVLRYWESEFPQIKPRRVARQRLFRHKDLELVKRIHHLLHNEGFTINGAKKQLAREQDEKYSHSGQTATLAPGKKKREQSRIISQIRDELTQIQRLLDDF